MVAASLKVERELVKKLTDSMDGRQLLKRRVAILLNIFERPKSLFNYNFVLLHKNLRINKKF